MARKRVTGAASPLDAAPNLGNALQLDQAILGQLRGLGGAQPGGLVIADDGTVSVGSFRLTGKGLIAQDGAPLEQWTQLLKVLAMMSSKLQMLIGDTLAYGERQYGETYQLVADIFGRQVKTVYQWKWVASSVDFSIRIENGVWGHYQLLASKPHAEQAHWLRQVQVNNWTVAQLREAISPTEKPLLVAPADTQKALLVLKNMTPESLSDDYHRQSTLNAITRVREWLDQLEEDLHG